MDLGSSVQGVQGLVGVQVPQDDDTVLTSGSVQGSVWGDGDAGDVARVANEVGVELVLVQVPGLDVSKVMQRGDVRSEILVIKKSHSANRLK